VAHRHNACIWLTKGSFTLLENRATMDLNRGTFEAWNLTEGTRKNKKVILKKYIFYFPEHFFFYKN